ncbi:response regulator [Gemmata sp. JC717]|uniref:response regulator n=1 Tax=Gemmata algarum TaxID=2975278 RepID=UPI0021BB5545|nr:response regulator [Gemmata algarum]MDY3552882.1 response regulator [Gemmata algarum]
MGERQDPVYFAEPAPWPAGRVLLAGDAAAISSALRQLLERAGVAVETVENGRLVLERAGTGAFDAILMDMQMPEMGGYAATRALRRSGYSRAVVALTAHALPRDEEECLRAGCDACLSKPIDPDKLIQILRPYLPPGSWGAECSLARFTAESSAPPAEAVSPRLARLTADYRQALPEKVRAIGAALREGDLGRVSELAHKLRGSAGMYGLPHISAAAGAVEDACRAGHGATQLGALVGSLCVAAEH